MWWSALALMAFNDHVLKSADLLPPLLTGKISDFAGLLVAPVLMAVVLRAKRARSVLWCHVAVGAVFAGIQLSTAVAGWWSAAMGSIGFPWQIVCDPTDLIALPMLLVSWRVLIPSMAMDAAMWRRGAERLLAASGLLCCVATSQSTETEPDCSDEDGDGWCAHVDCDDFDPAVNLNCGCTDVDGDGACAEVDCDDSDPEVSEICGFQDSCQNAESLFDEAVLGSTVGSRNDIAGECGGQGGEVVYVYDVPGDLGVPQLVTVQLTSLRPHGIAVRTTCDESASELACAVPSHDSSLEAVVTAGERLLLVVEAAEAADETDFELSAVSVPLICGDGTRVGPEECDDGNRDPGDGCDGECRLE